MKLLAPNGKPSNLNEQQWQLVRTPEFKRWFGDWEKLAYAKLKDAAMDEVTLENLSKNVSKVVDENDEPMVVWHSSPSFFNIFDKEKSVKGIFHFGTIQQAIYRLTYYIENIGFDLTPYIQLNNEQDDEMFEIDIYWKLVNYILLLNFYDKNDVDVYFENIFNSRQKEFLKNIKINIDKNKIKSELDKYNIKPYFLRVKKLGKTNDAGEDWELDSSFFDGYIYINLYEGNKKEYSFVVFNPNQIKLADGSNTTFDGNNPDIRFEGGGIVNFVSSKSLTIKIGGDLYKVQYRRNELGNTDKNVWFADVVSKNGERIEDGHLCYDDSYGNVIYGFSLYEVEKDIIDTFKKNDLHLIIVDDYGVDIEVRHIEFSNNPDIRFDKGGQVNSNSFMKWYIDWYKGVSNKMNIVFSLPNAIQPFKEKNAVILDLFEKKDQSIDAKSYLNEIIEKADKYEVTIYLEPKPRYKYFQDNSQKKNKITREYLIDYYEKFGFQLTPNKKFMKRLPIKKYANGESSNFSYEIGGVLHGSPYDFERFSTEKIGTGEGAQAFGWGLYFTNLEDIAREYTKAGEGAIFIDKTPLSKRARFQKLPQDEKIEVEQLLRDIANGELTRNELFGMAAYRKGYYLTTYNFIRDAKEVKFSPKATLYKVTLHKGKTPDQYTWLEWDKIIDKSINTKLIEQAKKEGILKEREGKTPVISKVPTGAYFTNDNISGQDLYENLTVAFGSDKEASLFLLRAGIDGIKYPAESISRGATSDTARGFNYVVFDENAVTIEEKTKFKKGGNTEWNYEIGGL